MNIHVATHNNKNFEAKASGDKNVGNTEDMKDGLKLTSWARKELMPWDREEDILDEL